MDQRAQGFASNPYPCIGNYRFLNLTLINHPLYESIVSKLKSDSSSTYLDIGCCFGQDLRQLVLDGVPSSQLVGIDIEGPLLDLGYELFLDQKTLDSRFAVVDVFNAAQNASWTSLVKTGADVVHCSAFFHLFPLQQQIDAAKIIAQMVKKGGVIVGRQSGSVKPAEVPAVKAGTTSFRHDLSTLSNMWRIVGVKTGTKWNVEGTLDEVGLQTRINNSVEDENSRRLLFTVRRED